MKSFLSVIRLHGEPCTDKERRKVEKEKRTNEVNILTEKVVPGMIKPKKNPPTRITYCYSPESMKAIAKEDAA